MEIKRTPEFNSHWRGIELSVYNDQQLIDILIALFNMLSVLQRAFICTHEGCTKSYVRNSHLKRHIQMSHSEEKPFKSVKFLSFSITVCLYGVDVAGKAVELLSV